jgi:hypothetical protein
MRRQRGPFRSMVHCLHLAICILAHFKFALKLLENLVNLNNDVGKYGGRNQVRCKNDGYHYTMHVSPDGVGMIGRRTFNFR